MHILLCDDEIEILDMLKNAFEKIGCSVTTADSGNKALDVLKEVKVDAVLTDFWMQSGDGGMLAQHCKNIKTPCAVMTGFLGTDAQEMLPTTTPVIGKLELIELILPYETGITKRHPIDVLFNEDGTTGSQWL